MTTIPVLWVSHHDDILARGYADQGLLEAVLDRSLWRPPGALEFEHHEIRGARDEPWPDVDGALVVVNARTHASPRDLRWLTIHLNRLAWSVLVLAGDEEVSFPWWQFPEGGRRRVWVMQPRPEHAHLSGLIPGGWYPGTREGVRTGRDETTPKPVELFFGGQVTHERRVECVKQIWEAGDRGVAVDLIETDGYLRGVPQSEYWYRLARSRVVPCPSGPYTVDTARPLEALEAGCVPIVDSRSPLGPEFDYWRLLDPECPLRMVGEWDEFPAVLAAELAAWPHNANRDVAWWCAWKRRTAHRLHDDLRAVSGLPLERVEPDDRITVVVTTSPAPLHPSTEHLGIVIASIRAQLPRAEILVVCDGVRPEQEERRDDYGEYVRRLIWRCQHEWANVLPVVMGEWGHQANALRLALTLVTTSLVLVVEHDTPLDGEIDWLGCAGVVESGEANVVRFHHEASILVPHRPMMVDDEPNYRGPFCSVPLMRTVAFWNRPHLARADWYREILAAYFPADARTFVEDRLYPLIANAYLDRGEPAWWDWRIFLYAPPGETMMRSWHLDSRGTDPKWPVSFE